jgi:hypothetical protein
MMAVQKKARQMLEEAKVKHADAASDVKVAPADSDGDDLLDVVIE